MVITARKRSLRQGNVFTSVCDSVPGGGVSAPLHAGIHPLPPGQTPLLRILRDTVKKRAVCILLEYIPVPRNIILLHVSF